MEAVEIALQHRQDLTIARVDGLAPVFGLARRGNSRSMERALKRNKTPG
jgi:hypothetical protein